MQSFLVLHTDSNVVTFTFLTEANTAADKSGGAAAGAGLKLSSVPRSGTEGERKGGGGKALEEAMQLLCVWLPGSLLLRPMLAAAAAQVRHGTGGH
jgi:hypothetical protein